MPDEDLLPTLSSAWSGPTSSHGGDAYAEMIVKLQDFLNAVAGARPDSATTEALTGALEAWTGRLDAFAVAEKEQVYGRRRDLVGRGQATWPAIRYTRLDEDSFEGVVTFGRYFLGRNGVVHGGVIMLVFDEAAGRLAHLAGRSMARTAFLRSDFRSVAPIEVELALRGGYVSEEGRKRRMHIELRHGETLCAEAEALMVALREGQR
jgi:acyl-coenzyme A thioesterase PaaI-like protein